jgi:hypothetical protein
VRDLVTDRRVVAMNEQAITPGSYLQELIAEESRAVAKRNNAAGYISMWSEAVRKVMQKFPSLSAEERVTLRGTVEAGIGNLSRRTRMDIHQFSATLGSVARILGGTSC